MLFARTLQKIAKMRIIGEICPLQKGLSKDTI